MMLHIGKSAAWFYPYMPTCTCKYEEKFTIL